MCPLRPYVRAADLNSESALRERAKRLGFRVRSRVTRDGRKYNLTPLDGANFGFGGTNITLLNNHLDEVEHEQRCLAAAPAQGPDVIVDERETFWRHRGEDVVSIELVAIDHRRAKSLPAKERVRFRCNDCASTS
jgi:hypothetical protein